MLLLTPANVTIVAIPRPEADNLTLDSAKPVAVGEGPDKGLE